MPFLGHERFFRPGYNANLVANWIPKPEGVEENSKLVPRWLMSDVPRRFHDRDGTGLSKFGVFGFDYHKPSIERAKILAKEAGVGDRITFAQATAKDFPAKDYDLVAFFDCLHDMGDPVGAGKHVKETLAKDGSWMVVDRCA